MKVWPARNSAGCIPGAIIRRGKADYELASPVSICDLPQNFLEPILLEAAGQRGTSIRFNTEFVDLVQDADGVSATVKDRLSGETYRSAPNT